MLTPPTEVTNIDSFAAWYDGLGNPIVGVSGSHTWITDDAVSVPIYRWQNYQVELYIVSNPERVPPHSHPGVQVIQKVFGNGWGILTSRLTYPETHGNFEDRQEGLLITYERWRPDLEITSLAVMWKGASVGPVQEELVKKTYPGAIVEPGWIDCSVLL